VQRISGGITCTLVEGIVQDELFIDTDLGIVSGDTLTCLSVMPDTEAKRIICTLSNMALKPL